MNALLIELIYTIFVVGACMYIVEKTRKLFALSQHKGIQYLELAFLYFGFAFVVRLLYVVFPFLSNFTHENIVTWFCLLVGSMLFFYSTFYKYCEYEGKVRFMQHPLVIIHLKALILTLLIELFRTAYFAYILIITISLLTIVQVYNAICIPAKKMHIYTVAIAMMLFAFFFNFLLDYYFTDLAWFRYTVYIFTSIIFIFFAVLVARVMHGKKARTS